MGCFHYRYYPIGYCIVMDRSAQFVPHAWRPYYSTRASGTFDNPNIFAVILFFCVCLLFQAAMDRKSGLVRYLFILICGCSFIGLFLSMERAVWLAGSLAILGLLVLYPKPVLRLIVIVSLVVIVFGSGVISRYINAAANRIGATQQIYDRIVVTNAMIQMVQTKPIFGWGFGTVNDFIGTFTQSVGRATRRPGLPLRTTLILRSWPSLV